MKLISDAGSTKTTWIVTSHDGVTVTSVTTPGINPATMSAEAITAIIATYLLPSLSGYDIDSIEYYGAGVISDTQRDIIAHALSPIGTGHVTVESDMLGAAKALLGNSPGIACILGTGSNTCLYDGHRIVDNVPALGFILGDEGSGASLGRRFIGDLFKRLLPIGVMEAWRRDVGMDLSQIINRVYRKESPNTFLGSLAPFIHSQLHVPEVASMVDDEFDRFFTRNIERYETTARDIGIVGSIAWYFKDSLERVATGHGYNITALRKTPLG